MKAFVISLVVGLGLLASGCAATVPTREAEIPVPTVIHKQTQQAESPSADQLPPASSPGSGLTPPAWYWMEQPQRRLENQLQQQWNFYNQNRQPPPQFPRAPICHSTLLGGQVITHCY